MYWRWGRLVLVPLAKCEVTRGWRGVRLCPHLPTEALAASPRALLCLPGIQMPAQASQKGPLPPPPAAPSFKPAKATASGPTRMGLGGSKEGKAGRREDHLGGDPQRGGGHVGESGGKAAGDKANAGRVVRMRILSGQRNGEGGTLGCGVGVERSRERGRRGGPSELEKSCSWTPGGERGTEE